MRLPPRLTLYEINAATWLERLGRVRGRPLGLGEVPVAEWDALAALPVDAVWLMGVWQRSPKGLHIALADPGLDVEFHAALPDLRSEDVIGSPYCVRDYVVDDRFGGPEGLAAAREQLAARGLGLILDYVPNHVAPDHPWTRERSECLLPGTEQDLAEHPDMFIRTAGGIAARGRDPYFPPWPDVVQLNAFSPALREAVADTLFGLAAQCDGLRCDMAMLMTNEVFARTWGTRAGPAPAEDYWSTLIPRVKREYPDMLFIAEAYWDMEWTLQEQGFDLCYDKRLYDRLLHDPADSVRGHLQAERSYQERLIRFIENHDEPRAAASFESAQTRAAAVVMSTLQGARLYHDGQFEGRRTHLPVFLGREPEEQPDPELAAFYRRLLRAVADAEVREGEWQLCVLEGWSDNDSYRRLVAWCWATPQSRHLVAVNLSAESAQARVRLPWDDLAGEAWGLEDRLDGHVFEREGDELAGEGLYVALGPWGLHFLALSPHPVGMMRAPRRSETVTM
ncbi:MAG TPA: alpha-amylase family glycosyl hydrolase [Solirubrobacteraceae bacterium]|nr:alpha-amylase family glycosyl hydrolase [Solirubrobacteraceae bacterium]